jgi:hypothetical protein
MLLILKNNPKISFKLFWTKQMSKPTSQCKPNKIGPIQFWVILPSHTLLVRRVPITLRVASSKLNWHITHVPEKDSLDGHDPWGSVTVEHMCVIHIGCYTSSLCKGFQSVPKGMIHFNLIPLFVCSLLTWVSECLQVHTLLSPFQRLQTSRHPSFNHVRSMAPFVEK